MAISLWPSVASVLSFSDLKQEDAENNHEGRRGLASGEEGRMWVFIRPGVVRSANEEEGKLAQQFCPIHRFDGNHQFLDLVQKGPEH